MMKGDNGLDELVAARHQEDEDEVLILDKEEGGEKRDDSDDDALTPCSGQMLDDTGGLSQEAYLPRYVCHLTHSIHTTLTHTCRFNCTDRTPLAYWMLFLMSLLIIWLFTQNYNIENGMLGAVYVCE